MHSGVGDEDGTTPFSEREEEYDSRDQNDYEDGESRDDFVCVPVNNIDNETVQIKILEDESRGRSSIQKGEMYHDHNDNDIVRSLRVLVGG